jgi:hypothetical protein
MEVGRSNDESQHAAVFSRKERRAADTLRSFPHARSKQRRFPIAIKGKRISE